MSLNEETGTEKRNSSVWFSMVLVAVISVIIGFAAGYLIGFERGMEMPVTIMSDTSNTVEQ